MPRLHRSAYKHDINATHTMVSATPPAKALPAITPDRCTGCGWCVAVCPPHVLSLQVAQGAPAWGPKQSVLHDAPACTGCALCAVRCPFDAIRMVHQRASPAEFQDKSA